MVDVVFVRTILCDSIFEIHAPLQRALDVPDRMRMARLTDLLLANVENGARTRAKVIRQKVF